MRRIIVTGGTAGIGKAAALELARRGAAVTVLGRDQARGADTLAAIEREAPGSDGEFVPLDLSDLTTVRDAAAILLGRHDRIDVLVANAGVHNVASRRTADGFDHMLAANYLGHFLLTTLLLSAIESSAPSRIVVVGSEAYRLAGPVDPEGFEDLGEYRRPGSFRTYGMTKLLEMMFARELARQLAGSGVSVNSVDPGTVSTGLYADIPVMRHIAPALSRTPAVRTPEQGARMIVRLADDAEFAGITGRYFSSVGLLDRLPEVRALRDIELQRRVWERTEMLIEPD